MSNQQKFPTKRQLRAYFLCVVLGETQDKAGKMMGISRQAVSRRLARMRIKNATPQNIHKLLTDLDFDL